MRDVVREVAAELHRLQGAQRDLRRTLEPGGVTLAALAVLRSVRDLGPCVLAQLGEDTGLDTSVVSRHVSGLVEAGLVVRTVDPADGRAHPVSATVEGERVLDETGRALVRRWDHALADWSDDELAALASTLRRLRADLDPARCSTQPPTQRPADTTKETVLA